MLQLGDGESTVTTGKRSDGAGSVKDGLLGSLIEFMESSEFDPKHAKAWINATPSDRTKMGICQENFAKGINNFGNSSYIMVANTQIGKTLAFLFLIFKAGLTEGMPAVLLTKNNTTEVARFQHSVEKFNEIVRASWSAVKKAHGHTCHKAAETEVRFAGVLLVNGTRTSLESPPAKRHVCVDYPIYGCGCCHG